MGDYKFKHVVAAGSWDHFHAGHKDFLQAAFAQSERVSLGITTQVLVMEKLFADIAESFELRKKTVVDYIRDQEWTNRAAFETLDDIYGPAIVDGTIEALMVTPKTVAGGLLVNKARAPRELPPLQLVEVPLKLANDGREISSERIRGGEINREGLVYLDFLRQHAFLVLPKRLRKAFSNPFGLLLPGKGKRLVNKLKKKLLAAPPTRVVCVGDVVTRLFSTENIVANVYIVDLVVERERRYQTVAELGLSLDNVTALKNPAGMVAGLAADWLHDALVLNAANAQTLLIDGEEDLLVLPAVLASPLGAVILYGQPNSGVVWVEVTESKKEEAYNLLTQFTPQ